jgi:hypothetical protein
MIPIFGQSGSSDGEDDGSPPKETKKKNGKLSKNGQFYARVKLRDDVHGINLFFAEVLTFPPENKDPQADKFSHWPGVKVDVNEAYPQSVNVRCTIRIRGIDVPTGYPDFERPQIYIERERARFDDGMHFVWGLISDNKSPNNRPLILYNPVVADDGFIDVDVSVMLGAHELDVAGILTEEAHAMYGKVGEWDWGHRAIRKIRK